MREWLSGRALPCQGKCREFESRFPLHTKRDRSCAYLFLRVTGNEYKKNSPVRVTEQSLIAREYAEGLPCKSNTVVFAQGKRHYLVSAYPFLCVTRETSSCELASSRDRAIFDCEGICRGVPLCKSNTVVFAQGKRHYLVFTRSAGYFRTRSSQKKHQPSPARLCRALWRRGTAVASAVDEGIFFN